MQFSFQTLDVPLKEPFRIATGEVTTARNVLAKVSQDGIEGVGEATPFEVVTRGTQASVVKDLDSLLREFSPAAKGGVAGNLELLQADKLGSDSRHALDVALHDWAAQKQGVPLATYLGGAPRPLPTSVTIPIVPLDDVPRIVRSGLDAGFSIFKIKSRAGVETETKRIRMVRDLVGKNVELRVDANAGWTLAEARAMLPVLRAADVRFLEQPLLREDLAGHAALVREKSVPIMLDESIFTLADAKRVRKEKAADLFNVKLAKSGGITEAGRILRYAEEEGVDCMIGCMIQTRIAVSADAHVAAGFAAVKFVDVDGHTFLQSDPVAGGVHLEKGRLKFLYQSGQGARLSAAHAATSKATLVRA
jgi:L-Ala-D/L-Glu epimerase